jgi:hypothetical protein
MVALELVLSIEIVRWLGDYDCEEFLRPQIALGKIMGWRQER